MHQRCQARGVPVTPVNAADWSAPDNIRFFFCMVGGVVFEVITFYPKSDTTGSPVPGSGVDSS